MEEHLGRKLLPSQVEQVHHINGIKNDNRIENLLLVSPSVHQNLHALKRREKWKPRANMKRKQIVITEDIYLKVKGKMAAQGLTFSDWVAQKIQEEIYGALSE